MNRVIIRCDASLTIGSGHVMRCRTIARELCRRGAAVTFICRRQPGDLINLLESEFEVLALPEQKLAVCDGLVGRDLYCAWLGCSQDEDAAQCIEVLDKAGIISATWIVADHYGLDAHWELLLLAGLSEGDSVPRLLVIDDLADRPHHANLLLDQNFLGQETHHRYQKLLPPDCLELLGPYYALLGSEYAQLHPLVEQRTDLHRVLVFFGGVDLDNLTCRVLQALLDPALAHLSVDVVLGVQCPHRQAVAELVAHRPNTTLHRPLSSLAVLIARADLAIGAGGATTWERACLRLPSLVVTIADNQLPFIKALEQADHLQHLGDGANVTTDEIRSALLTLITEQKPVKVTNALTDGWGAPRLVMAMLGLEGAISLRPAIAADEGLLSHWFNDPQVRANGSLLESIEPEDHHWLQTCLTDPNRLLLIAMSADGCPLGQLHLHLQPDGAASEPSEVLVDLVLDRCAIGKGFVSDLVRLGLQAMEKRWGSASEVMAEASNSNLVINACYARTGFSSDLVLTSNEYSPLSVDEDVALLPSRVTLLSDRGSWINTFLPDLIRALWQRGHAVRWIHTPAALSPGDVCLLLSCGHLLNANQLSLHCHNLVVHESALPQGQGWSPMTWQILKGASSIPITLFEAVADLDAGPIYLQQEITLQGHELVDDWRHLQARASFGLCLDWFDRHQEVVGASKPQYGESTYYPRRRPSDSRVDPELSLAEQFNLLRVVDNQRYPAFFHWRGQRFTLNLQSDSVDME